MLRILFLVFTVFLIQIASYADNPYFHKVGARNGDSIYKLLERYHLEDHECNFTQFFELNNLDRESHLLAGEKYFIPVIIYKYNGKTIRSTIGIESWEQALRIKKYNEALLNEELRKKSIASSRILWVPYHELHCLNQLIATEKNENTISKSEEVLEVIPASVNISEGSNFPKPFKFNDAGRLFTVESEEDGVLVKRVYHKTNNVVKGSNGPREFPIFGTANSKVPLVDNSLSGKVYYIVSGHGGPDAGAVGKVGNNLLCEDEYAYDVALRLTRELVKHGATAYMITRDPNDGIRSGNILRNDTDEYCWGNLRMPRGQKQRLYQRSDMVNVLYQKHLAQGIKDQRLVAIHVDSRSKREQTDLFFYYYPGSRDGKTLAKQIHQGIKSKYHKFRPGRGYSGTVTARDLHMLRETFTTSVYVELGNIRNTYDRQRILPERNRQLLAEWLFYGLTQPNP